MKKLMGMLCACLLAAMPLAHAQDKPQAGGKKSAVTAPKPKKESSDKQKAHQARMKDCSARAGDRKLKGDARKQFMSECLRG
ncbi:MAG TPA: PsiF family protein [Burkholderiales bacterium]|jgi:hypothetical protein|nr:PsiF family protein [Burkholderiales bacterium]